MFKELLKKPIVTHGLAFVVGGAISYSLVSFEIKEYKEKSFTLIKRVAESEEQRKSEITSLSEQHSLKEEAYKKSTEKVKEEFELKISKLSSTIESMKKKIKKETVIVTLPDGTKTETEKEESETESNSSSQSSQQSEQIARLSKEKDTLELENKQQLTKIKEDHSSAVSLIKTKHQEEMEALKETHSKEKKEVAKRFGLGALYVSDKTYSVHAHYNIWPTFFLMTNVNSDLKKASNLKYGLGAGFSL